MTRVVPLHDAADTVLRPRPFDHPDSLHLLHKYAAERRAMVGFDDPPGLDQPHQYTPPAGLFLVAYTDIGGPVACGGYRPYPERDRVVEIRKMYVEPVYRRIGIAVRVLAELERHAAAGGTQEIILETGSYNTAALHLYSSAGYLPAQPYVPGRPSYNRAYKKKLSDRT